MYDMTLSLQAPAITMTLCYRRRHAAQRACPPLSWRHEDHPSHAEAVSDHAKARGKEGLGQRHLHLPTVGQRSEQPLGLGIVRHRERQRKALEAGPPEASPVGSQHRCIADAEGHMHHLVLATWRHHGGVRAFLEAHEHRHLGSERAAVELDRLLAATVEEQIGLDLHVRLLVVPSFEPGSRTLCRSDVNPALTK